MTEATNAGGRVNAPAGAAPVPAPRHAPDGEGPPALETRNLGWHVGGVRIVDDVSLAVAPGEFVAVIGPNGAGKTSLLNLLSGLRRPSAGHVLCNGADITRLAVHKRSHLGIGRSFQSSAVFGSLSVEENVRLAVQSHRGGSLRAWPRRRADAEVARTSAEILEQVGLASRSSSNAKSLSHGDKRKLEIALMLACAPRVLLLDEPMAGVSAEDVPGLVSVIRGVASQDERSVVMVEHHMDVVLDLADRVAVMHHGALLICDRPDVVIADPTVQTAYLGEGL
jgi:branched-chain amino acid transport system ATP-binding protein